MVNDQEMVLPENSKRPMGFRHLGSSPFSEGESQTSKIAFNGFIYSTNIHIRLYSALQMKRPTDFCKNVFGFVWPISGGSLPKLPLVQTPSSAPFFR